MNGNVEISIKKYDEDNIFITVKRGQNNLYMDLGICQFNDEMEYWDMPVKTGKMDNEFGFIFSNDLQIEDIKMEIERFIVHNRI